MEAFLGPSAEHQCLRVKEVPTARKEKPERNRR